MNPTMYVHLSVFERECDIDYLKSVVRPVGPWRFLTPMETIAAGDLYRCVSGEQSDNLSAFDINWTVVREPGISRHAGNLYRNVPNFECIRKVDETSFYVPLYDPEVLAEMSDYDADEDDDE